jgi:hypothetical protein
VPKTLQKKGKRMKLNKYFLEALSKTKLLTDKEKDSIIELIIESKMKGFGKHITKVFWEEK